MDTNLLSEISRNWWVLVIYGIAAILFGIIALLAPLTAAIAIVWMIGLMALLEGVISIASLFSKNAPVPQGWLILYATLSFLFGLLTIFNPAATAGMLLIFLAVWLIIAGIYRILFAIRVRKHIRNEWMIIASGALVIVLGILLIAQPLIGLAVTAIWIGAAVLIYGVLQIMAGLRLRKLNHPAQP